MAGVDGGISSADPTRPLTTTYRSARPALRRASAAVRVCVVVLSVASVVGLVAAAITGWALTINPAAARTPLDAMGVSDNVAAMVSAANLVTVATASVSALTLLVAAVFVIRWQLAGLRNLPDLGAGTPRWSPLAAVLAWFVPVWAFFAPKQILNDLWRTSEPGLPFGAGRHAIAEVRLPAYHTAWWWLWIGVNVLDAAVAVATLTSDSAATVLMAQLASVVVSVGLSGAGVWLLRIMRLTTRRQELRYARLRTPVAPGRR